MPGQKTKTKLPIAAMPLSGVALKATKTSGKAQAKAKQPGGSPTKTGSKLREIFEGAGFMHLSSDDIHFHLQGRQGEIDHIFVWENVILVCEETTGKEVTKHCTNKVFFHRLISEDWPSFLKTYRIKNLALDHYIGTKYNANELEVRHIYFSEEQDLDAGVADNASPFLVLSRANAAYFSELVRTISISAKYEILKFLNVTLSRIGKNRISGGGENYQSFLGFALPAAHTNYPPDFAIVSFYANPMALITRAYVLRRDGWESPDLSYQRFVKAEKLAEMREYLANNGKVFINNLIVTLPADAFMKDIDRRLVNPNTLTERTHVSLHLPLELGTVGIVDGQHRILAYFEDNGGPIEEKIESLRSRQNLLVTGIIFPANYNDEMRVKFEAELFLSINNTQTGVHTQLRQDLETIINPETPLAIGRTIITRLSREGALSGMLQVSQFDPPERIATGSLGPYVMKPLLKKGSAFYKTWDTTGTVDLSDPVQRNAYIDYSIKQIKRLLAGCSDNLKDKWKPVALGGILSTTIIGGLLLLLERLAEAGEPIQTLDYRKRLKPLKAFDFTPYRSSAWAQLSRKLLEAL